MLRAGFLVGLLVLARVVHAAPTADAAQAQRHYTQGTKLYNLSMWKAALEAFQQAYLAKPDPALLFNIGQCQRQLGDASGAMNSYRAFLREARSVSSAQREQVQALIDQLEQAVREQRANQPPIGTVPPTPEPVPAAPPPEAKPAPVAAPAPSAEVVAPKPPIYKRWYLWVGVGAVVLVGVGVGLGVGLTASRVTYPSIANPAATVEF